MNKQEPLGTRLERLRLQKKLTAKQMAEAINVAESTYRDWERNKGLKLPPFEKISEVLSISVSELITGQSPELQEHVETLVDIEKKLALARIKLSTRI